VALLIEVFEPNVRHVEHWGFEDWRCQRGDNCCSEPAALLGNVLKENAYGNEYPTIEYPFVALMDDGTALVVCEDCAVALEEDRVAAEIATHEAREQQQ
jgi:hypothetical protein